MTLDWPRVDRDAIARAAAHRAQRGAEGIAAYCAVHNGDGSYREVLGPQLLGEGPCRIVVVGGWGSARRPVR